MAKIESKLEKMLIESGFDIEMPNANYKHNENGQRVAETMSHYIDENGAVTSIEVLNAIRGVIIAKKGYGSRSDGRNYTAPSCNRYMKQQGFKEVRLHEVIGSIMNPPEGSEVKLCGPKGIGGTVVFYKDEKKMRAYLKAKLRETRRIVEYEFLSRQ